jgi:beta-lactamase regulating signal transducer with metallopeptidase domain
MLTVAQASSAVSVLLVDSAVKGTALLVLAVIAAMMLRGDSAATRHLVWLLAIVAILVVPLLSAMLPEWRVLPEWASISPETVVAATSPPSIFRPADGAAHLPKMTDQVDVEGPSASGHPPALLLPDSPRALVTRESNPTSAVWSWNRKSALPLPWAIGFSVVILRLLGARIVLWSSERQGTCIWWSTQAPKATRDPIVMAIEAVYSQLGMSRPVTLVIDPDNAIPVVWGILRSRLLLPAAARAWGGEQLRSVLLHELAHVKRRDTMAQLLVQIACALYWFNPLAWYAAWRLGVERERACDDLVLASGVRPSAYAGHLLEVVTGLSGARWRQSRGLAMARKSSLEGRLVAVLSDNLNRRGVSVALAAIALTIAAGIAVPIAMVRAAAEEPGTRQNHQKSQKTKDGAKLDRATEEKLKWGEPVNGLRAAIAIRGVTGELKVGDTPELYLAIRNVSDAPIRLSDATAAPRLRYLKLRRNGETLFGIIDEKPTLTDVMLEPREIAFLLIFVSDPKGEDGRTSGSLMAEDVLKDTRDTLVGELKIEHAAAGAWTGKLITGETTGSVAAGQPQPKDKSGQALINVWRHHARGNGNIPGGLVDRLGAKVKEFIRLNIGDGFGNPHARKMEALVGRFDAARDWTPAEVVALMDDIAAITPIPLITTMDESTERTFKNGEPLPPELADAPWGNAQPDGLRMAWLLEPRASEHRLGTALRSRILFHNAGKDTVVFRARTWHQSGHHQARDAKGADIQIKSTHWTTIGQIVPFRLEPGEYVEVIGAGIGVGPNENDEDWQNTRVGSWIAAKAGDEVSFKPDSIPTSDGNDESRLNTGPRWWLDFINTHLAQDLPLPADDEERSRLVYRAGLELFGTPLSAEEIAAFVSDHQPSALDSLAKRLAQRPGLSAFSGVLTSGPTRFRVLPADPDAAKRPRTASNPGRYTLGENAVLVVTRRPEGERIVNEASIRFSSPDPNKPAPGNPHEIRLPDGENTWAAAWIRGATMLWVAQKGTVRNFDFTNPAQVKETILTEPAMLEKVPKPILDALRASANVRAAPAAPAAPAATNQAP